MPENKNRQMKRISDIYFSGEIILSYIILMPIFTFAFLISYRPFNIDQLTGMSIGRIAFMSAMIMCIEAVTILVSRMIMLAFRHKEISMYRYLFWEIAEAVIFLMFTNLFIWLFTGHSTPYFSLLSSVLLYGAGILIFPYSIISLVAENRAKASLLTEKDEIIRNLESGLEENPNRTVHFIDEKGNLKLMVTTESILYIEGADNYVKICYLQNDRITNFSLRNTMKGIEEICQKNSLIRCHRSYFINLRKVRIIQKEREGLFAELEHAEAQRIPISKTYYNKVVERFSALSN